MACFCKDYKKSNECCGKIRCSLSKNKPFNFKTGVGKISPKKKAAKNDHNGAIEYRNKTVCLEILQTCEVRTQVLRKRNEELIDYEEK